MIKPLLFSSLFCFFFLSEPIQMPSLNGNIWIDNDDNYLFDNEVGINGVKIYLKDFNTDEIIDSTLSTNAEFSFPSSMDVEIPMGDYYLEVPLSEFINGGNLEFLISCPGSNPANDGVDNDDNGSDNIPLTTTSFTLDNSQVEYVDLCFASPCNEANPLALGACDEIDDSNIICDITILATFCNQMPTIDSPGNQPTPLCDGVGVAHNMSWFAFVAFGGVYELVLTPFNCQPGGSGETGIQVGVYTDCTFTESVVCEPNCLTSPFTISSDDLVPGEVYYLFIDGCGPGTVCNYAIDIIGNPLPPTADVIEVCFVENNEFVCFDSQYCVDDSITLEVLEEHVDALYNWSVTTISGEPYTGAPQIQTETNSLDINFDAEGVYTVCIESVVFPCSSLSWFGSICQTITIDNEACIDECEEDTTEPIVQGVSLSTAVLSDDNEVRVYAKDFIIFAQDDCTPLADLRYTFNPNGPEFDDYYDESVNSSYKYLDCCNVVNSPEQIDIYVLDSVGNAGFTSVPLTILPPAGGSCDGCENDTIPPDFEAFLDLYWTFPQDSSYIEIWASDFSFSVSDNCAGPSNIKYSFTPTSPFDDPEVSFMVFLCEDVENSPFTLPIYTWDKSGNFSVDTSTLHIQSQMDLDCDQFVEEINGTLLSIKNNPIEGATLFLLDAQGNVIDSTTTDMNGHYSMFALPKNKSLLIEYESDDSPQISYLDLVAIQRYMLGLAQFSAPEVLASDVNGDGKVRVNDLRILRKIILGVVNQVDYLNNNWNFSTTDESLIQISANRFAVEQAEMPTIIGYQNGDLR